MKKIYILSGLALLISFSCLHAQIDKGKIVLGGTFSFTTSNASFGQSQSNTNISPRIGYAIGHNSVLYVRFGASLYTTKSSGTDDKYRYNSFSAGISWKKLFSINEKFGWYTDTYATVGKGSTRQTLAAAPDYKTNNTSYAAGINPGIYFMATPHVIVNADFGGLSYTYQKNKTTGVEPSHASTFNVNLLNYFGVGVDFIISKKKS